MSAVASEPPRAAVSGTCRSSEGRNPVLFPCYPKYKDSGVEWLGKVPSHWEVVRFKQVFSERDERSKEGTETLLSVSAYTGVTPRADLLEDGEPLSRSESFEGYKVCHPDDLVVNIMLAWNRGLAFTDVHGIVSPAYCVYAVIDDSAPRFLNYLVRSDEYIGYFKAFSSGVIDSRLRIYPDVFGRLYIALPPEREQETIAAFLDRETGKIDALISEQGKLIALLKEKRQALISHAVTKGLDPNAPMKDSGIEWLGQVPAHWEVVRLRRVVMLNPTKAEIKEIDRDVQVSFLPMEAIGDDGSLSLGQTRAISEVETGYTYFRDGDVTVAKITPCFENGKGAVMQDLEHGIGFGTTELIVARPMPDRLTGNYLARIFSSRVFRLRGEATMYGAGGQKRVPDDFVRGFAIGLPPISEQIIISKILDKEDKAFDTLVREAEQATALLKERRAALISAAVTGKICVLDS